MMMVSSLGYRKAQILQAYFNQGHLLVRRSQLYDFSTLEKLNQHVDLFMLYLASHCVGDTRMVKSTSKIKGGKGANITITSELL